MQLMTDIKRMNGRTIMLLVMLYERVIN